jgi:hypothetical protein
MKTLLNAIFLLLSITAFGQATSGTVRFTITTVDNYKKFSPDHVLAIWVETGTGNFVKTLQLQAGKRKQHLYTWNAKSGGNKVDAISGPTLSDHGSHTVVWNCKDTTETVVKDGQYQIVTEYTDEHKQGPIQTVTFTKGTGAIKLNPAKQAYFIDMNLVYTPDNATGSMKSKDQDYELNILHASLLKGLAMEVNVPEQQHLEIGLYNQKGKLVQQLFSGKCVPGKNIINWNLSNSKKSAHGKYVIIINSNRFVATRNVVI